jgi:hypothetical protein
MAALDPVDAALSVGQRIGRYFALVSMIPALLLVLWVYILAASGSLSGNPSLHGAEAALSHWSVGKAAGILVATLAIALILQPLQFATTQLLEGYWGTSALATAAMKIRIVHHRRRQRTLEDRASGSEISWKGECLRILRLRGEVPEDQDGLEDSIESTLKGEYGDSAMFYYIAEQEARAKNANSYPSDAERILPTGLGNALRCFEDAAGKQYGLSAITISPHLHLIVPSRHLEYLIDAREDMDSAIRICTVGLIATGLTAGFLLTHGLWLLWAFVPYFVSYLSYKGAVSAAQGYGSIFSSVIDLDRFLLYEKLGVARPQDSQEELETNEDLMRMLAGDRITLRYRPESPTPEAVESSSTDDSTGDQDPVG